MNNITFFLAPCDKFEEYAKTIPNPKFGCSTSFAIDKGIKDNACCKMEFDSSLFGIEVVQILDTYAPVLQSDEIKNAYQNIKSKYTNVICMVLADGTTGQEETLNNLLGKILPSNLPMFGGSSSNWVGADPSLCCKDDSILMGSLVVFIGTELKYYFNREICYHNTNQATIVTKSKGRIIYELDGKRATDRYKELSQTNSSLKSLEYLGKYYDNELLICETAPNNDGSLTSFIDVLPGSIMWILKLDEYKTGMENCINTILSKGTPIVTLISNCISRKGDFESNGDINWASRLFSSVNGFGFNAVGEDYKYMHVNKSMITLTFYK